MDVAAVIREARRRNLPALVVMGRSHRSCWDMDTLETTPASFPDAAAERLGVRYAVAPDTLASVLEESRRTGEHPLRVMARRHRPLGQLLREGRL